MASSARLLLIGRWPASTWPLAGSVCWPVAHCPALSGCPGNLRLGIVQPGFELVEQQLAALLPGDHRSPSLAPLRSRSMP